MGRTRLFGKLQTIAARVLAERRAAAPRTSPPPYALTRRQLALGGAQLAAVSLVGACNGEEEEPASKARIAVIGAGIAGLHCAYRLQQAGADVTVYEASDRVGGRMFTGRVAEYGEQTFELGGELIDSNHATMLALAEELGLTLDDRFVTGIQNDVWFVGGAEVPEATIVEQFTAVAPAMVAAVEAADSDDDAFTALDETPLSVWLAENVPSANYPALAAVLDSAYRGEFGLETSEQSALNLLYLIGADEPDPFRIFGESDERYHAREGNDEFPKRLAAKLKEGTLKLRHKLTRLGTNDNGYEVEVMIDNASVGETFDYDHVVLALPFSVLRFVVLHVPLSDLKRQIIEELGYGTNAKIMGSYERRVWRDMHMKSGSVTSDLPLQQLWDSSIGQPGDRGILTNFLGGQAGVEVGEMNVEAYYTGLLSDIETIFPGTAAAYRANTARLMHWPSYEHTRGSYTCYRPGQWAFYEQEGTREGNLHFCGEHTSVDYQGWMEGGAESGALVAAAIIEELGLQPSAELSALLAMKTIVPQPALRGRMQRLGLRERRTLLSQAAASRRQRQLNVT